MDDGFFTYHLPNLFMATAMYSLIGRFLLSLLFPPTSEAAFWRVYCQVTEPFVAAAAFVTPAVVPRQLLPLVAVVWLFGLRIGFFLAAVMFGFLPRVGAV